MGSQLECWGAVSLSMQGSPPFDGDVEESHELRYTLNSTTTGSPHTDLVSTPDQPSHDRAPWQGRGMEGGKGKDGGGMGGRKGKGWERG